jgi:AcrR family transcriptional regulator
VARPRDQAARRAQLVQAASRAVLERGLTGARLRDVADHAGLTSASVLYYYSDLEDLLAEVFDQGTRTYIDGRRAAVEAVSDPWDQLVACIRSGVPFPGEPHETSRLLYELVPLTFRNETAATRQATFFSEQADLYRQVLVSGEDSGTFRLLAPADFLARSLVALEDGYGIEVLAGTTTAHEIESRLRRHARLMTQAPPT